MTKKNKELKEQIEAINKQDNVLNEELSNNNKEIAQSKVKSQELQQLLEERENHINKMLGGSYKLSNMLLFQRSLSCKMGQGDTTMMENLRSH